MPEITLEQSNAGARSAVAILEAIANDDWPAAHQLIYSCDAPPTIIALATAWQMLAEIHAENIPGVLAEMRATIPAAPNV